MAFDTVKMRLTNEPFELIKSGIKTVEVRLYDEKRSKLQIGDRIVFSRMGDSDGEKIVAAVVGLHRYAAFRELYAELGDKCGIGEMTVEQAVMRMYGYYSPDDEIKFGVLGIELKTENML